MSQTVARALEIVQFITKAPRTLTEVALLLDVHKSTALRLLQTLEVGGFARQLSDGAYVAGFGMIALAQQAIDQIDIRSIAHPHLLRLAAQVGHTIHLAQLMKDEVVYVDKVDGSGSVTMGSRIGLLAETHSAAVAKVVFANVDESIRERAIAKASFHPYTPTTITTATALRGEFEKVSAQGWAEDNGEKEDYINCVALPVYDARGRITTGMSVTALRTVAPLDALREQIPLFRQTAHAISQGLGWEGNEYGQR